LKEVLLLPPGRQSEEVNPEAAVRFIIEETLSRPPFVLVKFKGIDTPELAAGLTGRRLLVPRSQAAPLKAGEYYIEDLKGCNVEDAAGKHLGTVKDIVEGGGGLLAEVALEDGSAKFVPFRGEFFSRIDVEAGVLTLKETWILE
jgi:16S rRNA processing protein RimM